MRVDGGTSNNNWMMQFLADILNIKVERPTNHETTVMGAAYLAGLKVGFFSNLRDIEDLWKVNVMGPWILTKHAWKYLSLSNSSRIIVLVSMSGKRSKGSLASYSMSKFALMSLCQTMRNEGWDKGIRVTAICPGWVNTDMAKEKFERNKPHVNVGTIGHVDHGKSTLVNFLTGQETDRLTEEKQRGLTINLGFTHFEYKERVFSIVDVPGHSDYFKNTVSGFSNVDGISSVSGALQ